MGEVISDNEILNSYNNLIPYLPLFFEDEVVFTISDTEKFLQVVESKNIKVNARPGDAIRPGGAAYECIKAGKPMSFTVAKEIFGVEVKAIGIPVKDENGQIVGSIVLGKSITRQNEMLNLSQNLSSELKKISSAINQISSGAQNLASSNAKIQESVKTATDEAENNDEILTFVKNVADQTNLLGLNAAIEAARAGEMGRGFSIVAQEIRKLSNSSSESINQISAVLKKINDSISNITQNVNETDKVYSEQTDALLQITSSIEELSSTAKVLEEMASKF